MENLNFDTPGFETTKETVLVYDSRTGIILHIHDFLTPKSMKPYSVEEKESQTLLGLEEELREKIDIEIYHVTEKDKYEKDFEYSIDLESKSLLGKPIER